MKRYLHLFSIHGYRRRHFRSGVRRAALTFSWAAGGAHSRAFVCPINQQAFYRSMYAARLRSRCPRTSSKCQQYTSTSIFAFSAIANSEKPERKVSCSRLSQLGDSDRLCSCFTRYILSHAGVAVRYQPTELATATVRKTRAAQARCYVHRCQLAAHRP